MKHDVVFFSFLPGAKWIRVHDLRHSHASYLISKGAKVKLIAKRLGHAEVSTTLDKYSHFSLPTRRKRSWILMIWQARKNI
ncbi:MAG TPA: tyrosine-type recombinase/integrase [Bacillota bacterium]|nr:tyrosine-type recombinase/integrase [Bacillota bacterium]